MLKVHVLDRLYRHSSNVAHGVEVPAGARLLFTNGQTGTRPDGTTLEQFLVFVKTQRGRMGRVHDVSAETIQAWMDDMAAADLALETMRMRLSAVSSFCPGW